MKMNPSGSHLTDEQLSELLDGVLADDAAAAHVVACGACAARLGDLRSIRAGLRAMRGVTDMPDFRLGSDGLARSATPRIPHPRARIPQVPRFISAAVMLCGMLLLGVAFISSTSHGNSMATGAASNSFTAPCTNSPCPAAGVYPTPSMSTADANQPTPQPTHTASTTPPTHTSNPEAPLAAVPVEWGLGVLLTLGGGVFLLRRRQGA